MLVLCTVHGKTALILKVLVALCLHTVCVAKPDGYTAEIIKCGSVENGECEELINMSS
jgi:hypothetical protein